MAEQALVEAPELETVEAEAPEQEGTEQAEPHHRRTKEQIQRDSLIDMYEGKSSGDKLPTELWLKIRKAQLAGEKPLEVERAVSERESQRQEDTLRDALQEAVAPLLPRAIQRALPEVEARAQQIIAEREIEGLISEHEKQKTSFREAAPDFDEVLSEFGNTPMSPHIQEAILRLPNGPAVLYTIAKEGDIERLINPSNSIAAIAELGRISARLADDENGNYSIGARQLSKPPTPVKKVVPISKFNVCDDSIPTDVWLKLRRQQVKAKRGY